MKDDKSFFATGMLVMIFAFACYAAFWGGLIFFVFWCAKHFGLI